jgi:hypothetical protein
MKVSDLSLGTSPASSPHTRNPVMLPVPSDV